MARTPVWMKTPVLVAIIGAVATIAVAVIGSVLKAPEKPTNQPAPAPSGPAVSSRSPSRPVPDDVQEREARVLVDDYPSAEPRDDSEYIALLESRAARILSQLDALEESNIKALFADLHKKHLEAVRNKQPILAHEIVGEIHHVLASLSRPDVRYKLERLNDKVTLKELTGETK